MNADERKYSPKRFAISSVSCPSCHVKLERDAKWCDGCGFTGAKSMGMFGDSPPPLLPILDVADLWDEKAQLAIEAGINAFGKRFPQIRWRMCAVALGPEVSLPLFAFWLMNASPLLPGESDEDREWSILLLVDSNTGRASVAAGYQAEVWLSDEMWQACLAGMPGLLQRGLAGKAVLDFLGKARGFFELAFKRSRKQLAAT